MNESEPLFRQNLDLDRKSFDNLFLKINRIDEKEPKLNDLTDQKGETP